MLLTYIAMQIVCFLFCVCLCNTIDSLHGCIRTTFEEAKYTYVIVRSFFEALGK